eukprot:scaffold3.g6576.t1
MASGGKLLQGKTVLITGASRGIGAELSCALAREGAKLVLVGSPGTQDELHQCAQKCKGEGVTSCECKSVDLADPQAVDKVNAAAPMRMIRAFAPKMASKGDGAIISIGDVEAMHTGPSHPAYAASKYALRGFTLSAYEALRHHGIKVCNIAAGNVGDTAMAAKTSKQAGGQGQVDAADVIESVLLVFRLSKNAVPEELVIKALRPGGAA